MCFSSPRAWQICKASTKNSSVWQYASAREILWHPEALLQSHCRSMFAPQKCRHPWSAALAPALSVSHSVSFLHSSEVSWSAGSSSTLNSGPPAASPAQRRAQRPGDRSHGGPFQRLAVLDCGRRAGLHCAPHRGLHPLLPLESLVQAE